MQKRSRALGAHLHRRLRELIGHGVLDVRGVGLWAGIDIDPALATGRENEILCLEAAGKVQRRWGQKGNAPGDFDLAHMLAFDDGTLGG